VKLAFHKNTEPYCGSVGPIAYDKGRAYSVNTIKGEVSDWRYDLKYSPRGCKECERHMVEALKEDEK
jgi:hypothetical protein